MKMKKFGILMVSAAMMAGMVSCTAQSPDVCLNRFYILVG